MHAEPTIAAAQAGKHVLCEKPLSRNAAEGYEMWQAVAKTGVKHMVAHNYRFVPAIRLARDLIASGKLGKIYHFRAVYLQEWIMPHYDTGQIWRLNKDVAGSGAIGDLGSHIIDLGRFLCGEVKSLQAMTKTFIPTRYLPDGTPWQVDVDDAFVATFEFENGAIGTIEASRFAAGRKNYNCWEINGEKGSIRFDLERMNELEVFWVGEEPQGDPGMASGARDRGLSSVHRRTGGRTGTLSGGSIASCMRSTTCSTALSATRTLRPWAPRSRTATATRSSATGSWSLPASGAPWT